MEFISLSNREVVTVILSGKSRDDVLDEIHNKLRDLGEEMRAGKIDIEQYEINRVNCSFDQSLFLLTNILL